MRLAASLLLTLTAASSFGADTWTQPFAGVRKLYRTTTSPREEIHALEVRLDTPGVRLRSTATGERRRTVSSFANLVGAQVAINADFFNYTDYATVGLAAGDGAPWPGTADSASMGTFAFGAGRFELAALAPTVTFDRSWMLGVVSGKPDLLRGGAAASSQHATSFCTTRHPRTALGLSQDGRTLYLAVVDGRSAASVGMTCAELATLLSGLGAHHAMNLDGGGSSAMFVRGQGVVNRPSDGAERVVANHLAVFAPAANAVGTLTGIVSDGPNTAARLAGVTVRVTGGPSLVTDTTGLFALQVPAATWTITASKPGFVTQSITRTVTAGATVWGSMALARETSPVDTDLDGVADTQDNCPAEANADQRDADRDGLGDACDGDADGDGVPSEDDNCPLDTNPGQEDRDGDGLGDACDSAPNEPRDAGAGRDAGLPRDASSPGADAGDDPAAPADPFDAGAAADGPGAAGVQPGGCACTVAPGRAGGTPATLPFVATVAVAAMLARRAAKHGSREARGAGPFRSRPGRRA